MTEPHPPTNSEATPRRTDLTLIHVAAAALAAVTTAVIGSTLGTAGTLIGAVGASVITTVGTAVYRSSLERSRDTVRSLAHHTPPPSPSSRQRPRTTRSHPNTADTPLRDEQPTDSRPQPRDRLWRLAPQRWRAVVVGTLGAFLLAMLLITGFEWANGTTIGGNGNGTTIGRVINDQPAPRNPAPPSPHSPSAPTSDTPTDTPTAPDTTAPGGDTSVEPSPTTTDKPTPSTVTPPPPLIPTQLPGLGN
ncbi:MAG: copper transporter family protein [Pseudonocardiaceae bacterium]